MSNVEQGSVPANLMDDKERLSNGHHEAINGEEFDADPDQSSYEDKGHSTGELIVAYQALDSFDKYRSMAHSTIHRRRQNLYALPSSQWKRLAGPPFNILDVLSSVDDAIDANSRLADAIVASASSSMNFPHDSSSTESMPLNGFAKINDHNKAQSTLRQFYRDWTAEGFQEEVKPLLDIILVDLAQYSLPSHKPSSSRPISDGSEEDSVPSASHILLPGAGLSRLLLELTLQGHNATGNEISYHQLMASNFILNHNMHGADSFTIYPWATNFCNTISRAHQLQAYTIPDMDAATAVAEAHASAAAGEVNAIVPGQMGMAAGDFCTSFNGHDSAEEFTSVVTAYFIDTAPNLFRYIQTVHNCLRDGGLWINIGPLLWHFDARDRTHPSDDDDEDGEDEEGDHNNAADTSSEFAYSSSQASASKSATPSPYKRPTNNNTKKRDQERHHHNHDAAEDAGIAEPGSFELTNEEVLALVAESGFEILFHEILPDGSDSHATGASDDASSTRHKANIYLQDPGSMMQVRYRCGHWVARKKAK